MPLGDAGSAATVAHPDPIAPVRMWMGINIRRVAHTVEFFFVGLFASSAALCLDKRMLLTDCGVCPSWPFAPYAPSGTRCIRFLFPEDISTLST